MVEQRSPKPSIRVRLLLPLYFFVFFYPRRIGFSVSCGKKTNSRQRNGSVKMSHFTDPFVFVIQLSIALSQFKAVDLASAGSDNNVFAPDSRRSFDKPACRDPVHDLAGGSIDHESGTDRIKHDDVAVTVLIVDTDRRTPILYI